MRILITGATGFVGKNLLPKLIKGEHAVFEITIQPDLSRSLYGNKTKQFDYLTNDSEKLKKELTDFKPELVIHLASYLTSSDETKDMQKLINSNIFYLCHVLDAVKETGLKWFINTGSFSEFYKGDGVLNPAYLYAATKTASRIFVDYYSKVYSFNYINISPYTIYGGIDSQKKIIDFIFESLGSNEPINLTTGNQILDFIHLEDVTDFYITCISNLNRIPNATSFQLGTGRGSNLKEVVSIMEKFTQKSANINWGGKPHRPRDIMYAVANISLQYHLFNWKPKIPLEEGIKMYLSEMGMGIK